MVPVAKRDTKDVRLCAEFKVTISPVIREDKFPLPRVEDILAKMAGGKRFSKIDLKNSYQALTLSNLDHWLRGPVDLRSYWSEGQ